eukprot:TRINITY_DN3164_c3_g1_i1.p1 TRINITY_DN3164_c3_g1~~TRINITY_DN3164_c3_g1_i1.p1  ORF type:complete len:784 (+),score=219.92 TRINITY_DN3164_c3_g1_i1:41-2392(+)
MSCEHPLLGISIKQTLRVNFKNASEAYATKNMPDDLETIVKVAEGLDTARDETVSSMQGADVEQAEANIWKYYQKLKNYSTHIPSDGLPSFQWTDCLSQKSQAAKADSAELEFASFIMNIASLHSTHASNYSITGRPLMESAKEYLLSAGIYKYLEEHMSDEKVFDLRKSNLSAMQALMLALAAHCLYLQVSKKPQPDAASKLAVDLLTHYTSLEATFRVLEGLNPEFMEFIVFFKTYFGMKYWIHRAEAAKKLIKDKDPYVEDRLGMLIHGLHAQAASHLPLPRDVRKYQPLANEILTQLNEDLRYLQTENDKVYRVRVPKELETPKLVITQKLNPKVIEIPSDIPDELAQLPNAKLSADFREYKTKTLFLVAETDKTTEAAVIELRTKLSTLEAVSLLASMPSNEGPILPESLTKKLQDNMASTSLRDSFETMQATAELCSQDLTKTSELYNDAKASDESGFQEFGDRWYLGTSKFSELPEGCYLKKTAAEYSEKLQSAAKSNEEMSVRLQQDFSLLEKSIVEHETWVSKGGKPEEQGVELSAALDELATLVNNFEIGCTDVNGALAEMKFAADSELEIMTELIMARNPEEVMKQKAEGHKERAERVAGRVVSLGAIIETIKEKVIPVKQQLEQLASNDKREATAKYIADLDKACTEYANLKFDLKQGVEFYSGMSEACRAMVERMRSFSKAAEEQCTELRQLLCLKNKRQTAMDADYAYASKVAQEQQQQQQQQEQGQVPSNQPQMYPSSAPYNPFAYATAPSAPPSVNPYFQQNQYGSR